MPKPLRPPPEPAHIDSAKVATWGTSLWAAAFVVAVIFRGWLDAHGHRDVVWTCLAGTCIGIFGSWVAWRHRKAGRTY